MLMLVGGENTSEIVSLFASSNGLSGFIGSVVGGLLGRFLTPFHFILFGMDFFGIQILFLIAGVLRLLTLFLLPRVQVVGHVSLKTVMSSRLSGINRRASRDMFEPVPRYLLVKRMNPKKIIGKKEKTVV